MALDYNKRIISKIINDKENLGKTAVMKITFILQKIFGMKLGYNFNIYTYGPYAADVTEDLEALIYDNYVDANMSNYKNSKAYRLTIKEFGKSAIGVLDPKDEENIKKVLDIFGGKNAKELELDSTIIYVKNQWNEEMYGVIKDVREIKPHFTEEEIESAYRQLEKNKMLVAC